MTVALIYMLWRKTLATAGLTLLCSLFLSSFPNLADAWSMRGHKPKLSTQQENHLKCGYRQKGINLNLPLSLLLNRKEGYRIEPINRCGGFRPSILLTALIPQSTIGMTTAEYPTIFLYIPDADLEGVTGELVLSNENEEEVYRKVVRLKATDSIIGIDLSGSPPLEVGKSYSWAFSIIFDERDRSADSGVVGWIKRVELNSQVKHKLDTALPQEKPSIYATNGIWYEALTNLAKLRCSSPNDAALASAWESLLQQVGLLEIARKPLAQCNR
jgi:hypothetical protein